MRFDVLSIFPAMFASPLDYSVLKKARDKGLIEIKLHNIRDWARDKHKMTDDEPYGSGCGMVMKVEPVERALVEIKNPDMKPVVILMTPQGESFRQETAAQMAKEKQIVLICGRYEGVDERIRQHLIDKEISIGDYILTGGELAALVFIDAVSRLVPGVLGNARSIEGESFAHGLLEYPQYTRPADYKGWSVPEVLLSGNHAQIEQWRKIQSLKRTYKRRPDLLKNADLTDEERKMIKKIEREDI